MIANHSGMLTIESILFFAACEVNGIGDNFCDDVNNNPGCGFDGGDCCGSSVNTAYCTICQCLE